MTTIRNVLTIAGSDSGGGAGIQADIKAMSARGVYACSVITALTAQNTQGVSGIHEVPATFVTAQLDAVLTDVAIHAVKIGMLATVPTIEAVAQGLERHRPPNVVLDPVMVAKSGDRLLRPEAVAALRSRLLPLAALVTPNLPELGDLLGRPAPSSRAEMVEAGGALRDLGADHVLVKGGHLPNAGESPDVLVGRHAPIWLEAPRVDSRHTHGTGCTLSSAIAAELARGHPPAEAVARAKAYLAEAIARADELAVGSGHGPVHHFHALWT